MEERSVHMQKLKDRKRQVTNPQQSYRHSVKTMFPQETEGTSHERMCRVAAKWQEQQSMQQRLPQENKSVL
jgi:ribosomal protein L13